MRAFLVFILLAQITLASNEEKLEKFRVALEAALKSEDPTNLVELHFRGNAAQITLDFSIHRFEEGLKRGKFDGIEFRSVDEEFVAPIYQKMTEGELMNGRLYKQNLVPIAFCVVKIKTDGGGTQSFNPVGMTPSGEVKFSLQEHVED